MCDDTQIDGATIWDCSGNDPSECRLAERHQPLVGKTVVDTNDKHEREGPSACADANVLMLVMYVANDEDTFETQAQLSCLQLQNRCHCLKEQKYPSSFYEDAAWKEL